MMSTKLAGRGQEHMQDRDEVFMLPSFQVPMVLRNVPDQSDSCTMIGAALVSGLMKLKAPTKTSPGLVFYGRMKGITIV